MELTDQRDRKFTWTFLRRAGQQYKQFYNVFSLDVVCQIEVIRKLRECFLTNRVQIQSVFQTVVR